MGEFLEGAEGDLFEQESDAAAGQDRQAEMQAVFAKAPPLFQAMLAKVMTDDEFSQIRDWVCEALFANWPHLLEIHARIFDVSQPKYLKFRGTTEESTSTHPGCVREACGKCPAMISKRNVGPHRAKCKGPSTIDVFMYFLACLLGIERTVPRRVGSTAEAHQPMADFLTTFVPGYQNGAHFVPQDTITNRALRTWLSALYGSGLAEEPVALDRESDRLRTDDELSGEDLQHAILDYVQRDSRVILQNIHDEPGFWAAVERLWRAGKTLAEAASELSRTFGKLTVGALASRFCKKYPGGCWLGPAKAFSYEKPTFGDPEASFAPRTSPISVEEIEQMGLKLKLRYNDAWTSRSDWMWNRVKLLNPDLVDQLESLLRERGNMYHLTLWGHANGGKFGWVHKHLLVASAILPQDFSVVGIFGDDWLLVKFANPAMALQAVWGLEDLILAWLHMFSRLRRERIHSPTWIMVFVFPAGSPERTKFNPFVVGTNAFLHNSRFFNTLPSPNPGRVKTGSNVQIGSDPAECYWFPMLV